MKRILDKKIKILNENNIIEEHNIICRSTKSISINTFEPIEEFYYYIEIDNISYNLDGRISTQINLEEQNYYNIIDNYIILSCYSCNYIDMVFYLDGLKINHQCMFNMKDQRYRYYNRLVYPYILMSKKDFIRYKLITSPEAWNLLTEIVDL